MKLHVDPTLKMDLEDLQKTFESIGAKGFLDEEHFWMWCDNLLGDFDDEGFKAQILELMQIVNTHGLAIPSTQGEWQWDQDRPTETKKSPKELAVIQKQVSFQITALQKQKAGALEVEDYDEAKRCKVALDEATARYEELGVLLTEAKQAAKEEAGKVTNELASLQQNIELLQTEKAAALDNEDYDVAKRCKAEMESATARIEEIHLQNHTPPKPAIVSAARAAAAAAAAAFCRGNGTHRSSAPSTTRSGNTVQWGSWEQKAPKSVEKQPRVRGASVVRAARLELQSRVRAAREVRRFARQGQEQEQETALSPDVAGSEQTAIDGQESEEQSEGGGVPPTVSLPTQLEGGGVPSTVSLPTQLTDSREAQRCSNCQVLMNGNKFCGACGTPAQSIDAPACAESEVAESEVKKEEETNINNIPIAAPELVDVAADTGRDSQPAEGAAIILRSELTNAYAEFKRAASPEDSVRTRNRVLAARENLATAEAKELAAKLDREQGLATSKEHAATTSHAPDGLTHVTNNEKKELTLDSVIEEGEMDDSVAFSENHSGTRSRGSSISVLQRLIHRQKPATPRKDAEEELTRIRSWSQGLIMSPKADKRTRKSDPHNSEDNVAFPGYISCDTLMSPKSHDVAGEDFSDPKSENRILRHAYIEETTCEQAYIEALTSGDPTAIENAELALKIATKAAKDAQGTVNTH